MSADMKRAREILDEVETLSSSGELTKERFQKAFRELKSALGPGIEREGIEALALYPPDPSWFP